MTKSEFDKKFNDLAQANLAKIPDYIREFGAETTANATETNALIIHVCTSFSLALTEAALRAFLQVD